MKPELKPVKTRTSARADQKKTYRARQPQHRRHGSSQLTPSRRLDHASSTPAAPATSITTQGTHHLSDRECMPIGSSASPLYHDEPITSPAVYVKQTDISPAFHIHPESKMTAKIAPKDNSANMQNANKGTPGTNKQYDQVQGNRGKQIGARKSPALSVKQSGKK